MFGLDSILNQLYHCCQHVLVHSTLQEVRNVEHLIKGLSIVDDVALSRTSRQIIHYLYSNYYQSITINIMPYLFKLPNQFLIE